MNDDTDTTHKTVQKTIWSDTLVEMLIVALKKNKGDDQILQLLKEIREKKFEAKYITGKIRKEDLRRQGVTTQTINGTVTSLIR